MKRPVTALTLVLIALLAVPAFAQQKAEGVNGTWKCVGKREGRPDIEFKLVLAQSGAQVTGTASRGDERATIRNGNFAAGKLSFEVQIDEGTVNFEASLSGDKLTGTVTQPNGMKANWEGLREGAGAAAGSAGVLGTWNLSAKVGEGSIPFTLELKQEGETLSGKVITADGQNLSITKAAYTEGILKFTVAGPQGNFELEGKLEGDKLSGSYTTPSGAKGPWEGTRQGSAGAPASAAITGKWKILGRDGERTVEYTLELNQEGGALSGKLIASNGETIHITKASVSGNKLKMTIPGNDGNYEVEGQLDADKLTGTYAGPGGRKGTWEGKRL